MPTPIISADDRALLEAAADYLTRDGATLDASKAYSAAALLRRLAVPPVKSGLLAFAQGEPNEYFITNNGHWVAAVKFNGEILPAKQEATLCAWLAGAKPAEQLNGLRRLCGYVENGSETIVSIFQDDATREWTVKLRTSATREQRFHGAGFLSALDAAIAGTPEEA